MMESGQSGFGVQSPKSPQQPMAPRNLPYPQQQPPMGQPQGGAMGGNAPRGIPGGENRFQKFGGGGGSMQPQTPMQPPQTMQPPAPVGGGGQFGGGMQQRPQIDPMAFQKLMEMLQQKGGQSPFGNNGSMPSAFGGGQFNQNEQRVPFSGGGIGQTGKSLY